MGFEEPNFELVVCKAYISSLFKWKSRQTLICTYTESELFYRFNNLHDVALFDSAKVLRI